MNKEIEKLDVLSKEIGISIEELEETIIDKELFMKIFRLFTHMSKRGKDATVQTLLSFLMKEV